MALPRPRLLALGLATLTVASVGAGTAALGDVQSASTAASTTVATPAPTAPVAPPAPAATAVPRPVTMWVRVGAANVWFKTAWVRRVDRPSLGAHPDLRRWVRGQSYAQRLRLGANLMTQALRGEQVVVIGTRGPWDHVRVPLQRGAVYRAGIVGWIAKAQLSPMPVPSAAAPALPRRGSSIVRAARAYVGTTYIFGGMTRVGIDCSGLTFLAAQRVGVLLPRDAADQARVGAAVARRALRPGDLVFFGPGGRGTIHHVGIYVGRGRILHAPHTGSTVRVSRLSSFRYYWGARRIVASG